MIPDRRPLHRIFLALALPLLLAACAATFNNWVKVTAGPSESAEASRGRLFALADGIAREQGLVPDPKNSAPPLRQGWFGPRYHYYTYELRTVDGKDVAVFVHQAHASSPRKRREEPEREFQARATQAFGAEHVETHFEDRAR